METDSTNTECLTAAKAGDTGPLWVLARRQTDARGSRGRHWTSYEGNLFASYLFVPQAPSTSLGQITFVIALAVHDALAQLIEEVEVDVNVALKWPNDVLLEGSKVCGILLESHEISEARIVIAGIGLNCFTHPGETSYPATSLAEHQINITARNMLDRIAPLMDYWLEAWEHGDKFQRIRDAWTNRAKGIGAQITVRLRETQHSGIFDCIDDAGRLVLRKDNGKREPISVADIFF
ncbi:MAG: biotin--[acetyl-CoA-carboxylase] ligase [Rhizobiaceae bacterium]